MRKFLKSPWTIGITTTLLSFMLTVVYDLVKNKKVFTTIGFIAQKIWKCIIDFLNIKIKLWCIILVLIALLIALCIYAKILDMKQNDSKPEFLSYTEDHFKTWKWSWTWGFNSYEKVWDIDKLYAHCPKCDTIMLTDEYNSRYSCPRCEYESQYGTYEKDYEVRAIILDNLRRKYKK